jgi:hypothetical protein
LFRTSADNNAAPVSTPINESLCACFSQENVAGGTTTAHPTGDLLYTTLPDAEMASLNELEGNVEPVVEVPEPVDAAAMAGTVAASATVAPTQQTSPASPLSDAMGVDVQGV